MIILTHLSSSRLHSLLGDASSCFALYSSWCPNPHTRALQLYLTCNCPLFLPESLNATSVHSQFTREDLWVFSWSDCGGHTGEDTKVCWSVPLCWRIQNSCASPSPSASSCVSITPTIELKLNIAIKRNSHGKSTVLPQGMWENAENSFHILQDVTITETLTLKHLSKKLAKGFDTLERSFFRCMSQKCHRNTLHLWVARLDIHRSCDF